MIPFKWLCLQAPSEKWDSMEIVCSDLNSVYSNLYQQSLHIFTIISYLQKNGDFGKYLANCFDKIFPI